VKTSYLSRICPSLRSASGIEPLAPTWIRAFERRELGRGRGWRAGIPAPATHGHDRAVGHQGVAPRGSQRPCGAGNGSFAEIQIEPAKSPPTHPAPVRLRRRGTTCLYYVMPYVRRRIGASASTGQTQLPLATRLAGITRQGRGARGLSPQPTTFVHRDINHENILLESGEGVVRADFGMHAGDPRNGEGGPDKTDQTGIRPIARRRDT